MDAQRNHKQLKDGDFKRGTYLVETTTFVKTRANHGKKVV